MSRVIIQFPEKSIFTTDITIQNIYINEANHVGNNNFIDLSNEVLCQFFHSRQTYRYTIGNQSLINTEFSVILKSEAKPYDILTMDLGVDNFHRCGCDFIIKMQQKETKKLVALSQFSFLAFDYGAGKAVNTDKNFQSFFDTPPNT